MNLPFFHSSKTSKRPISYSQNPRIINKKGFSPLIRFFSAILLGSILISVLYFLFRSNLFQIQSIKFSREETPSNIVLISEDILQKESASWLNYSIFIFPQDEEEIRILAKFPILEKFQIVRKFPHELNITFKERKQAAVIKARNGEFIVDENAYVFSQSNENIHAPVFEDLGNSWEIGEKMDYEMFSFALQIVSLFPELNLIPAHFNFENQNDLVIETDNNLKCYFDTQKDLELQFATLQILLDNAKIEGRTYQKIDLRFVRPIVLEK